MGLFGMVFSFLATILPAPPEIGLSTVFGQQQDRYNPYNQYACKRMIKARLGTKAWDAALLRGVAHRTLPCGKTIVACNPRTAKCTPVVVVDRGPYGAIDQQGRWHVATTLRAGQRYRGILDLLPTPAKQIGHNGREMIQLWVHAPH